MKRSELKYRSFPEKLFRKARIIPESAKKSAICAHFLTGTDKRERSEAVSAAVAPGNNRRMRLKISPWLCAEDASAVFAESEKI